MMIILFR